jgi:hypothetical protein
MLLFDQLKGLHANIETELLATVQRVAPADGDGLYGEVEAFETSFAAAQNVTHATAVTSAVDAVTFALRTAKVQRGDEVLTTAFVPTATLQGIQQVGAVPVFVDVDPASYTMCPSAAAKAVTPRTRALMAVHTFGQPTDMTPLVTLGRERNIIVIEDGTEAEGARYVGRPVGSLGDLGVFGLTEGGVIAVSALGSTRGSRFGPSPLGRPVSAIAQWRGHSSGAVQRSSRLHALCHSHHATRSVAKRLEDHERGNGSAGLLGTKVAGDGTIDRRNAVSATAFGTRCRRNTSDRGRRSHGSRAAHRATAGRVTRFTVHHGPSIRRRRRPADEGVPEG